MKMGIRKRYVVLVGVLRRTLLEKPAIAAIMRAALDDMVKDGRITKKSAEVLVEMIPIPKSVSVASGGRKVKTPRKKSAKKKSSAKSVKKKTKKKSPRKKA